MAVTAGAVGGTRAGEDGVLRRRLALAARTSAAAALLTICAGLVLAGGAAAPAVVTAVVTAPVTPPAPAAATPTPTVNRLSPTGTATSPVIWRATRTGDRAKDAVLAAYRIYLGTATRLWEEPDPADPALLQVALDPELSRLRTALSVNSDAQVSRHGRVTAAARVQLVRGGQAVVIACVNSESQRLYDSQGRRDPHWRGGIAAGAVHMRRDDGQWKVYLVTPLPSTRCHR